MSTRLPEISSYGEYASGNYGVNTLLVEIPGLGAFYFSYQTVVAFRTPKTGLVVRENAWGPTTGKHLNWIDHGRKKDRVPGPQFVAMLQGILPEHDSYGRWAD